MAKKITKPVVKLQEEIRIEQKDVLLLAKELGYDNLDSMHLIEAWIRSKFSIHGEIFYSMFHKKFSINNYFIDLSKGKKVEWDYKAAQYDTHIEALVVMLYNMLILLK